MHALSSVHPCIDSCGQSSILHAIDPSEHIYSPSSSIESLQLIFPSHINSFEIQKPSLHSNKSIHSSLGITSTYKVKSPFAGI